MPAPSLPSRSTVRASPGASGPGVATHDATDCCCLRGGNTPDPGVRSGEQCVSGKRRGHDSAPTARAITSTDSSSDEIASVAIISLARDVSGMVSVGLKAVELVQETYR